MESQRCVLLAAVLGLTGLTCCGGGKNRSAPAAGEQPEAAARPAVPTRLPIDANETPAARIERGGFALAKFDGDHLTHCWQVSVAAANPVVSLDGLALMIAEDVLIASDGGESVLANNGTRSLTALLAAISRDGDDLSALNRGKPMSAADIAQLREGVAKLATVPLAELSNGDLAKVESCDMPGRVALGLCHLEDKNEVVAWSLDHVHFDVRTTSDTDAGMKTCLTLGGHWTAQDPNNRDVAMERLRQHSAQLRKVLEQQPRP